MIDLLCDLPGLRIQALNIRCRGNLIHREYTAITIFLEYPIKTPPRASVADGAVFLGYPVAAITPAVVPGAPPRLPSAFAQPSTPVRLAALAGPTPEAPGRNPFQLNPHDI